MQIKTHWENIYKTKDAAQVSWFQEHPELSFQFIERTGVDKGGHIIDVGGGASTLVDDLLDNDYQNISVLDISAAAPTGCSHRKKREPTISHELLLFRLLFSKRATVQSERSCS